MKKYILIFIGVFGILNFAHSQRDSLYAGGQLSQVTIQHKQSPSAYKRTLKRVLRVYPYVLEAERLLKEFNEETKELERKGQVRKFGRKQNRKLKDEFRYAFKDMSRKDGVVMMKLIHRRTKLTTYDIIKKYRGKANANFVSSLGKLFDQDFKVTFDPEKDKVLGRIYSDIQKGRIKVPKKLVKLTRNEYKEKLEKDRVKREKQLQLAKRNSTKK